MSEFIDFLTHVKFNGFCIRCIPDCFLTEEICLAAVRENGNALRYVKEQSLEICLAAVKENGHALQYVEEQTPEICLAAVRQNANALKYVELKKD